MIDEQKYVVFKLDDLIMPDSVDQDRMVHSGGMLEFIHRDLALNPQSYTVIKHSDIFAPSALYGYANAIQTAIEIIMQQGRHAFGQDPDVENLEELRDLFFARAQSAEQTQGKKVPD